MSQKQSTPSVGDVRRILVLLRHGQSVWNQQNLFIGWADVDLTEEGIRKLAQDDELRPGCSTKVQWRSGGNLVVELQTRVEGRAALVDLLS